MQRFVLPLFRKSFGSVMKQRIPAQFPLDNIHKVTQADAFNIEGGKLAKSLRPDQIYVNPVFIMDNSLVSGVTLPDIDRICEERGYPLKEMAIEDYNEINVNLFTLLALRYYLNNGHILVGKNPEDSLSVVVHTFRSSSAIYINDMIAKMVIETNSEQYHLSYRESKNRKGETVKEVSYLQLTDSNIVIHFRRGFTEKETDKFCTEKIYQEADILFGDSMAGGLSDFSSGSILIPTEHLPLDEKKSELHWDRAYSIKNRLLEDLDQILAQPQEKYFDLIEQSFGSKNPDKKFRARRLTRDDCHPATLLEINDLWHPVKTKPGESPIMIKSITAEPLHDANNDTVTSILRREKMSFRKNLIAGTFGIAKVEELQTALKAGYRNFDLATAYKNMGMLREAATAENILMDQLKICVKINDGDLIDSKLTNGEYSARAIVDKILSDLQTRHIDTLMLHSPALLLHDQAARFFEELIYLKKAGLISHIGVSNFTIDDLVRLDKRYLKHIDFNSIEINPWFQRKEIVAFCEQNGITVMPYRPFGKGKVAGLLEDGILTSIAAKHGASVQQVILAWLLQQNMHVVAKAASANHLEANRKACDIKLDSNDMNAIENIDGRANDYNWTCGWEKFVKLPDYRKYMSVKLERPYMNTHHAGMWTRQFANQQSLPETPRAKL